MILLADILENARHEERIKCALEYVDHMVQLVITSAHSQGWMDMDLGPLGSITIDPAGTIAMQVQRLISTIHGSVTAAFATQWNSMGTFLNYRYEDNMILSDLVYFVLRVIKTRKQQGKNLGQARPKIRWASCGKVCSISWLCHVSFMCSPTSTCFLARKFR